MLTEYSPKRYGFMHLGLQEYLAAQELADRGGAQVRALAGRLGDRWWREVILLLLAVDRPNRFGELMGRVAENPGLEQHLDLLRQCLDEAHLSHARPFLPVLEWTWRDRLAGVLGRPRELARRRAAVLRLFLGREEPELRELARQYVEDPDPDLRALARRTCGLKEEQAKVIVEPLTGMRFLRVPGGRFMMGADHLWKSSKPAHPVQVSPFYLAETPVTHRQYEHFLRSGAGAEEPAYWRDRRFSDPEQPVVVVSWHEALAFCRWLSTVSGLRLGLPSEAQWEFAARGEEGRMYPWGEEAPDPSRACFGRGGYEARPDPVGSCPAGAGPFGHLDLAGTVWEWCLDAWSDDYRADLARAEGGVLLDPCRGCQEDDRQRHKQGDNPADKSRQGDSDLALPAAQRVVRGGSWDCVAEGLRCAFRDGFGPELWSGNRGFRVVCLGSGVHT